jgi:hypothetical protein
MTDMKGILRSTKKRDYIMHVVAQITEKNFLNVRNNPKKYKRSPDAIAQTSVIVDLEGFSMNHITYKPGKIFHKTNLLNIKELINSDMFDSLMSRKKLTISQHFFFD